MSGIVDVISMYPVVDWWCEEDKRYFLCFVMRFFSSFVAQPSEIVSRNFRAGSTSQTKRDKPFPYRIFCNDVAFMNQAKFEATKNSDYFLSILSKLCISVLLPQCHAKEPC